MKYGRLTDESSLGALADGVDAADVGVLPRVKVHERPEIDMGLEL